MEEKMTKTFEEKKEHAELMRNIFGITAVLYIGFIIWIACIHRYEIVSKTTDEELQTME